MKRPRVLTNFAMTADGKVSTRNQTPSGFTSKRDQRRLLEIRSLGDALLVGRGTAEADNMSMTISADDLKKSRLSRGQSEQPMRVLISNSGNVPTTLKVFTNKAARTLIYASEAMDLLTKHALERYAEVRLFPGKFVPLLEALNELRSKYRIQTVVCEGGPTLVKSLLEENLVDEMFVTIAAGIFGGQDAPTMTGKPGAFLSAARHFRLKDFFVENNEAYCHYVRRISL